MGAWGHGFFEDDTACDFAEEIEESKKVKQLFHNSFEEATNAEYLEYDQCHAVIISAVYLDALINRTEYEAPDEESFNSFLAANKKLVLDDLKENAVGALQRVLNDNSELNELWAENAELYSKWRQNILDLIQRLT